jgi:hypothetical protein
MKTKAFLRTLVMFMALLNLVPLTTFGQLTKMDSIIYGKNLNVIEGTIPTYFTTSCSDRAKKLHSVLQNLTGMYSPGGDNVFKLKLAVLDSVQWTGLAYPYGFSSIGQGWIVIPGDLNYQKILRQWGHLKLKDVIKKNLIEMSNDPEYLLTDAIYENTIVHELGHYYVRNVLKAKNPDLWTSELTAIYFAVDYLARNNSEHLKALDIFLNTCSHESDYKPNYRSLSDFNTKYGNIGLDNYIWYLSQFHFMAFEMHSKYGNQFLESYSKSFPQTTEPKKLTQEEVENILDKLTGGITTKWIKVMEGEV